MAPEILDGSMDFAVFTSYTAADVYSCSLILWEVYKQYVYIIIIMVVIYLIRCTALGNKHCLPFTDMVPPRNPTIEGNILANNYITSKFLPLKLSLALLSFVLVPGITRICETNFSISQFSQQEQLMDEYSFPWA